MIFKDSFLSEHHQFPLKILVRSGMSTCHSVRPKCSITYQCPVPGLSQSFLFLLSPPKGKNKALLTRIKRDRACPQSSWSVITVFPRPTRHFPHHFSTLVQAVLTALPTHCKPASPLEGRGKNIRKQHQLFAKSTSTGKLLSVPQPDAREQP